MAGSIKEGGPTLITPDKDSITYNAPTGEKQVTTVRLKNMTNQAVIYRIVTNRQKYYMVSPGKGIIKKGRAAKVMFELSSLYNKKAYENDSTGHEFHILAIKWPNKIDDYTADAFKLMEQKGAEKQRIVLNIQFEGLPRNSDQGSPIQSPASTPSSMEPMVIDMDPRTIRVAPPLTKPCKLVLANLKEDAKVAFKLLTNKPHFYVVSPNKGLIQAGCTFESKLELNSAVTIKDLQADQLNHQFLVLAMQCDGPYDAKACDRLLTSGKKGVQKMSVDVVLEVEGNMKFLRPTPDKISFRPADGEGQECLISLVNESDKRTAYKINAVDPILYKFYSVDPDEGIIPGKEKVIVTVTLKSRYKQDDLPNDDNVNTFYLMAFNWTKKSLDDDQWKRLAADCREDSQIINFKIDFDKPPEARKPLLHNRPIMNPMMPMGMRLQMPMISPAMMGMMATMPRFPVPQMPQKIYPVDVSDRSSSKKSVSSSRKGSKRKTNKSRKKNSAQL